jgi:hypothetical protein
VFDNLIAQCQEMIRPHAIHVGNTAEAYAQRIVARLDAIVDELQDEGPEHFASRTGSAQADAGGIADVAFDLKPGQHVQLLSVTASGSAAGGGTGAAAYVADPTNELNLLHVFAYAQRFSASFPADEYIDGVRLVVRFIGQTPGQFCTVRLKMKLAAPVDSRRGVGGQPDPRGPRIDPNLDDRHVAGPQFLTVNGAPAA